MELYDRVMRFIGDAGTDDFESLALAIFAHQFETIGDYRRVCERRGATPRTIDDWRRIPPVPTLAFKRADLCAGPPERVFLTTGTTQGRETRGRHSMPCLALYEAAAVAGMKQFLFPEIERMRLFTLVPAAGERPESSLAQMVDWALRDFGTPDCARFAGAGDFDFVGLRAGLRASEADGEPICLLTTTAALMHFLDDCNRRGESFRLTHGSRLMDTGGTKGTPRPLSRNGLLRAIWETLAIPGYFIVNEYGMTEMSSQFYDNVIRERHAGRFGRRHKAGPHWVRTRVLDPATLEDAGDRGSGVLCHTDLANAGSALVVLTEDVGGIVGDGFEIRGRIAGAEARGCSLALADFAPVDGQPKAAGH